MPCDFSDCGVRLHTTKIATFTTDEWDLPMRFSVPAVDLQCVECGCVFQVMLENQVLNVSSEWVCPEKGCNKQLIEQCLE